MLSSPSIKAASFVLRAAVLPGSLGHDACTDVTDENKKLHSDGDKRRRWVHRQALGVSRISHLWASAEPLLNNVGRW